MHWTTLPSDACDKGLISEYGLTIKMIKRSWLDFMMQVDKVKLRIYIPEEGMNPSDQFFPPER